MIAYEQKYTVTQDDPYLQEMRKCCTEKNGWVITEDITKVTFKIITWLGDYITQEEADLCGVQLWHDD